MYMTLNVLYMTKEKKVKIDLDLFYILYKKIVVHLYNSLLEKNSERGIKSIKKRFNSSLPQRSSDRINVFDLFLNEHIYKFFKSPKYCTIYAIFSPLLRHDFQHF